MNDYDLTVKEIICVNRDCIQKERPFIAAHPRLYMVIGIVTEGTMCYVTKDHISARAEEGDIIILFPGDQDVTFPEGEQTRSLFTDFDVDMQLPEGLIPRVCRIDGMRELFEALILCWNSGQPGYKIRCREILYQIINRILREQIIKTDTYLKYRKIKPAIYRMETGFSDPISVAELALLCDMSPSNLTRLFTAVTGKTPMRYLHDTRMAYAKTELARGERNMSVLAERCGYADVFSFSRSFKKAVGVSPGKYMGA